MIRAAKMQDIPAILKLLRDAHARSIYAETCGIDTETAQGLITQVVWGAKHHGSEFYASVSVSGEVVEGVLLGMAAPLYLIGDKLMASDLFWVASDRVEARDPKDLMVGFVKWAKSKPEVVEIRCGTTPVIQAPEKAAKVLKRLGMEPFGEFFRMEVK